MALNKGFNMDNPFFAQAVGMDPDAPGYSNVVAKAGGLPGMPNRISEYAGGEGGSGVDVINPDWYVYQSALNAVQLARLQAKPAPAPAPAAAPPPTVSQQRVMAEEKAEEAVKQQAAVATTRRTLRDNTARRTQRNALSAVALAPSTGSLF